MILGHNEIHNRLAKGEIFISDTWNSDCIKEASYALRVAPDGLMLEGETYGPDRKRIEGSIVIKRGQIAVLSTVERVNMPRDLVGSIGIRFEYACRGLIGFMGIQVDPLYGNGQSDERLYIRVANVSSDDIVIDVEAEVFTLEFHIVVGNVPQRPEPREPMWYRIRDALDKLSSPSLSNASQIQGDLKNVEKQLKKDIKGVKNYLQPLVMFGIFLIAVTILGVALTVIVSGSDIPEVYVPTWVRNWGWKVLLGTLSAAAVATSLMGMVAVGSVALQILSSNGGGNQTPTTGWVRGCWRKFWHWFW